MKRWFIVLLVYAVSGSLIAEETHLQRLDMHGRVRRYTSTSYRLVGRNDAAEKVVDSISIYMFNLDGNYAVTDFYNAKNELEFGSEFLYFPNGRIREIRSYDANRKTSGVIRYLYNDEVCVGMKKYKVDDTCSGWTTYKNDGSGNRIEALQFDADGKMLSNTRYMYRDNQIIEEISYDANNVEKSHYKHYYNGQGRIEESINIGKDATEVGRTRYLYNEDGYRVGLQSFENDVMIGMAIYKLDLHGNKVEVNVANKVGELVIRRLMINTFDYYE